MDFTIRDLVDLAKNGYKPNDVKELLELANTKPNNNDESTNNKNEPKEEKKENQMSMFEKIGN